MNKCQSPQCNRKNLLILLLTLALPSISNAEIYDFKVVYAEVPGTEEIRAGNHDAAIKILPVEMACPRRASSQFVSTFGQADEHIHHLGLKVLGLVICPGDGSQ